MKFSDLSEQDLENNFIFWRDYLLRREPEDHLVSWFAAVPTTHTFPASLSSSSPTYRTILFKDGALTSPSQRDAKVMGPQRPEIEDFDDVIFSYLGVHEPYYARSDFPAFGVFISRRVESYPRCIASLRDLSSSDARLLTNSGPISTLFVKGAQARHLAAVETESIDRFWEYWGNWKTWKSDSWVTKYEFHFHARLEIAEMAAVLWPREIGSDALTGVRAGTVLSDDAIRFKKLYPNLNVVTYDFDSASWDIDFVNASSVCVKAYIETQLFPSHILRRDA